MFTVYAFINSATVPTIVASKKSFARAIAIARRLKESGFATRLVEEK